MDAAIVTIVHDEDHGMSPRETARNLRRIAAMADIAAKDTEVLETVLDAIPIVMTVGDSDGWVLVSRKFSDLLGYTRADLISTPLEAIIHPDDLKETVKAVDDVEAGRVPIGHIQNRYRVKGTDRYIPLRWTWGRSSGPQRLSVAIATVGE